MALPTYNQSLIASVTRVQQDIGFPQFIMGGRGNSTERALFKKSTTYDFTIWRSPVYQIGRNFDVLKIKFDVQGGITGNKTIIPVLYFDHANSSSTGATINTTNYANQEKLIISTAKNFSNTVHGRDNFFLELQITGTDLTVVKLPISIELEVEE